MDYIGHMVRYTLAQAEARLPELFNRVLSGEGVVITRGKAAVELKAVSTEGEEAKARRSKTESQGEFLAMLRAIPAEAREAAGEEVSKMRDEEWGR